MKIRTGFISNSSSTSFVVGFPKEPKSAEDVQKMLFMKPFKLDNYYGQGKYEPLEVAKRVFEQIERQKRNNFKELVNDFEFKGKEFSNMKKDIESNENVSYYYFSFASDDGDELEASLRGGDVFRNLPHYIEDRS